MAEAQIDASETGVAGLDHGNAYSTVGIDHVAGEDFFGEGHASCGADTLVRCRYWRQKHFALHARYVKGK